MRADHTPTPNHRLRQERIKRNWRQQDLADQLETTIISIRRWERGSHQPSAYFREKLCILFGKSAEELGLIEVPVSSPPSEHNSAETDLVTSPPPEAVGLWTIPYLRNPHFTGRDDLLEQLAHQLSPQIPNHVSTTRCAVLNQPQAVKGLGGIGKTQMQSNMPIGPVSRGAMPIPSGSMLPVKRPS